MSEFLENAVKSFLLSLKILSTKILNFFCWSIILNHTVYIDKISYHWVSVTLLASFCCTIFGCLQALLIDHEAGVVLLLYTGSSVIS